jgi:ribonuclease HII
VLEEQIKAQCRWAVGVVEPDEIDRLNIFGATMLAMTLAVQGLVAQLDGAVGEARGREPDAAWAPHRLVLAGARDRGRRCDRAVHLGGLDHRQGTSRPADARRQNAIRTMAGSGTPAMARRSTWPRCANMAHAAASAQLCPVAQLLLI